VAKGKTNSSNISIMNSTSILSIDPIIAEAAIVARLVETFAGITEEVDSVETIVFKADQAIHPLAPVRRDIIYTQKKNIGQISTLRRRGIELTMNLRR
jgi:hypothetical protein